MNRAERKALLRANRYVQFGIWSLLAVLVSYPVIYWLGYGETAHFLISTAIGPLCLIVGYALGKYGKDAVAILNAPADDERR